MRKVVAMLLGLATLGTAESESRWYESRQVFATFTGASNSAVISAANASLSKLGFKLETSGKYPGGAAKGIFASFGRSDLAKAMVVEGTSEGCVVFAVSNYDASKAGLAQMAVEAVKARLVAEFRGSVRMYSDASCVHAL